MIDSVNMNGTFQSKKCYLASCFVLRYHAHTFNQDTPLYELRSSGWKDVKQLLISINTEEIAVGCY